jgi:hypothetical protein
MAENIKKEILKIGALPCYLGTTVKVGADETSATSPADIEQVDVELEQTIIEYTTYDSRGRTKRIKLITGIKAKLTGKRNHNDIGNNFLAKVGWSELSDAQFYFELNIPDMQIKVPKAVTEMGARLGAANDLDKLEVTIMSSGDFEAVFVSEEIVDGE